MKVRIVNPENAAGLIDPVTGRRPFVDAETGRVRLVADVPSTSFWHRRVQDHEIEIDLADAPAPTGLEPVTPLTTR